MRTGRDGVVGSRFGPEETHRHEEQGSDEHTEHSGTDALPEGKSEEDGEGSEQNGGERVRASELNAEQVARRRRAVGVGNSVNTEAFDLGDFRFGVLSNVAHCCPL